MPLYRPELSQSTWRIRAYTGPRRAASPQAMLTARLIATGLALLLGLALGFRGKSDTEKSEALTHRGQRIEGRVTGKSWGSKRSYYIRYAFDVGPNRYTGQSPVRWNSYQHANRGQRLEIVYLPLHPETSEAVSSIRGVDSALAMHVGFGIVVAAIIGGVASIASYVRTGLLMADRGMIS